MTLLEAKELFLNVVNKVETQTKALGMPFDNKFLAVKKQGSDLLVWTPTSVLTIKPDQIIVTQRAIPPTTGESNDD